MYNNGNVYVKALRIPKSVKLTFKNDDLYSTKKSAVKKEQSTVKENKNLMFMEEEATKDDSKDTKPKEEKKTEAPKQQPQKEEKSNLGFVIPDNINFSNIADTLKDTSKTESTEPKASPSASKTPIPQNKKQETAFSDLNGIFNNIGIKDNNRPSSPSQKPKIDSTCKPNFL